MKPKTPLGFTLIEITIALAILFVLMATMLVIIQPQNYYKKGRDVKRLNSLNELVVAIEDYKLDNGVYPDLEDTVRVSSDAGSDNVWIDAPLNITTQPIDPLNTISYNFRYMRSNEDYEIDAALEYYIDKAQDDLGNNSARVEFGTNFNLLN